MPGSIMVLLVLLLLMMSPEGPAVYGTPEKLSCRHFAASPGILRINNIKYDTAFHI